MTPVSTVITVYNKAPYLADVINALAREQDEPLKSEYIFVDDGSTDDSVSVIERHKYKLPGEAFILRQENSGASAATNNGVRMARHEWIRLMDGDDFARRNSTARMLEAARNKSVPFVIGDYGFVDTSDERFWMEVENDLTATDANLLSREEAIQKYVKNFAHNSSCILMTKALFGACGGCDERLVSPDYALALRAAAKAESIVHIPANVAFMPKSAPGRLSSQAMRSRYESVLALYYLAHEILPDRRDVAEAVYRRACSRAWRYARIFHHHRPKHFLRFAASRFHTPGDLDKAILKCLAAFTPDGKIERPREWLPGALRRAARP